MQGVQQFPIPSQSLPVHGQL